MPLEELRKKVMRIHNDVAAAIIQVKGDLITSEDFTQKLVHISEVGYLKNVRF